MAWRIECAEDGSEKHKELLAKGWEPYSSVIHSDGKLWHYFKLEEKPGENIAGEIKLMEEK